jgi:hypothetical protein
LAGFDLSDTTGLVFLAVFLLALMRRRINEAATEVFLISQIFFTATLFRYPTNVEVVLGIAETEENG